MAGAVRIAGTDAFSVTQFTPAAISTFMAISVYLLAGAIFRNRFVPPVAAFLISMSNFQLSYGVATYPSLTNLSIVLLTLWAWSYLRMTKAIPSRKSLIYLSICSVLVLLIMINHEVSALASVIIMIGFVASTILFSIRNPTRGKIIRYAALSMVAGMILSAPILFMWEPFLADRYKRVEAGGGGASESHILNLMNILPQPPLGAIQLVLALIGIAASVLLVLQARLPASQGKGLAWFFDRANRFVDDEQEAASFRQRVVPLIFWFVSMGFIAYGYLFGLYLINYRFFFYATIPLAIFAAFSLVLLLEFVSPGIARAAGQGSIRSASARQIIAIGVVLAILGAQYQSVFVDLAWAREHTGRPFLSWPLFYCMQWIRDNTPGDSIVAASELSPYSAAMYLPGISERPAMLTIAGQASKSEALEHKNSAIVQQMLALDSIGDLRRTLQTNGLDKESLYVLIGKEYIGFASGNGDKIDVDRMLAMYDKVYDNSECSVFRVDDKELALAGYGSILYGKWVDASGVEVPPAVNGIIDLDGRPTGISLDSVTGSVYVVKEGSDSMTILTPVNGTIVTYEQDLDRDHADLQSVAVNPDTNRVYVANHESDTVSVIDGETNKVIATVDVGEAPNRIVVNEQTNRVYVSNLISSSLTVIDGDSDEPIDTVQLDGKPSAVAVDARNNLVYIADSVSGVYVLDGELGAIVDTIRVGDHPSDIAVNSGTNAVYVVNHFSDSVSVVDGSTGRIVKEISVGSGPSGIALDAERNLVHVINYYSRSVSVFSEAQAQGPESDFVVSMDRGWAYSGGSASVSGYRLVRDDAGLSVGFNATQAEGRAFVSYTKDLSGLNLGVADAPYFSVEFTEIDESGTGRPQFGIGFADGTGVQIDDATTVRIGNRYHLVENLKEFGDKTVASITVSASSEVSAPLTSYQVNFADIRFAEKP